MRKNAKRIGSSLLCAAMVLSLASCTNQPTAPSQTPGAAQTPTPAASTTPAPEAGKPSGTFTGTGEGYGGTITATVTLDAGKLTACELAGPDETPAVGGQALPQLAEAVTAAASTQVDAVAGATETSKGAMAAVQAALDSANGVTAAAVKMAPGVYHGDGQAFNNTARIEVDVTVDESKMLDIAVSLDNAETRPILEAAIDKLVPRMLAAQSVSIDSITGCTVSSNGIKQAVEMALTEALAAGGAEEGAIKNFYVPSEKLTGTETLDVDILLVGMGGAGMAAMVRAAELMYEQSGKDPSKVNVLAIDKAGKYAGTATVTGDVMAINPQRLEDQFNNGEDFVDAAAFKQAWMDFCKGDPKEDVVDMFIAQSGAAADWLHFDQGFALGDAGTGFGPEDIWRVKLQFPNGHAYGNYKSESQLYFAKLVDNFTRYGGKYMLETEAYEFLYDEATNTVTGVKARGDNGMEYVINAKAVLMGTGGFIGNPEMQEEYFSNEYYPLKGVWNVRGMMQNDGKMVQAAIDLGAGTYNIDMPPMVHVAGGEKLLTQYPVHKLEGEMDFWTGRTATWSLNDVPIIMTTAADTLQLTMEGERFSNENGLFTWWQAGPKFNAVWSDAQIKSIQENGFHFNVANAFIGQGGVPANQPVPEIYDVIQTCIDTGFAWKADTLDELAQLTGMDADKLKASVARYNELCEKGVDEDFGKNADALYALGDEGPYYVVRGASYPYSVCGALDVNPDLQVLMADGETPINGLYAIGTDSMGTLYSNKTCYVTYGGGAQGWAFCSGKVGAEKAVEYVTGK